MTQPPQFSTSLPEFEQIRLIKWRLPDRLPAGTVLVTGNKRIRVAFRGVLPPWLPGSFAGIGRFFYNLWGREPFFSPQTNRFLLLLIGYGKRPAG
jgi:hypothetical protein